jgi:diadenosine tetraphosphate (Ap4A) HIT family hydrolase
MKACVFCEIIKENYVLENDFFYAIFDKYPVTEGHLLVIPKRHVETLFELNESERAELLAFVEQGKKKLDQQFSPVGFNFGVNQGESAGQTIPHLHLHIIPRYKGDMEDPEGGVRGVIPEKQKYKSRL